MMSTSNYRMNLAAGAVGESSGVPTWVRTLVVIAAVGSGAVGGFFLAFSALVMPALRKVAPGEGIRAMQAINVQAVTPIFMIALFGTAIVCLVVGIWTLLHRSDVTRAYWLVAAAAVYIVTAVLVTIAGNVPLNDKLATLDSNGATASGEWNHFLSSWVPLNHVRTVGCLVACVLFILAARGIQRAVPATSGPNTAPVSSPYN